MVWKWDLNTCRQLVMTPAKAIVFWKHYTNSYFFNHYLAN